MTTAFERVMEAFGFRNPRKCCSEQERDARIMREDQIIEEVRRETRKLHDTAGKIDEFLERIRRP